LFNAAFRRWPDESRRRLEHRRNAHHSRHEGVIHGRGATLLDGRASRIVVGSSLRVAARRFRTSRPHLQRRDDSSCWPATI